ncbi:MAG TPA: glutathione S-transferase family protein [Gammaproteobacteria bacterium]|nr:glutathione S-transferase family protein [Gammaproteobacteria bacterium]
MFTLYDYAPSQNAYKVRLLLNHLDQPYESVPVSIFEGAGKTAAYLEKNPVGAVPVLELADGRTLPESNAILLFLAEGTPYLPNDPWLRAQVARWLFFEEDYVQNGIASLRHWTLTGKLARRSAESIENKRAASMKTLAILDEWLRSREFLVEGGYTIADMALYAYVGFADEAGLNMSDYPQVTSWIARVRAQPGFLHTVFPYSLDPESANELP